MGMFDELRRSVDELFESENPSPKGDRQSSTEVYHGGVDRNEPPKDEMQKYWRLFETEPLVREPITGFAREVVEPGWYVTADSEETVKELTEWLRECAIIEGEKNKDFTLLARKVVTQREVRGTTLIEKVRGRSTDKIVALYLHNPEEFEVYTHPRTNILIEPDADLPGDLSSNVPRTEDGEYAAYVQYDTSQPRWRRRREDGHETDIPFTTEELIKFTRDADVGEVFGTSRIEAVAPRIEARQKKLQDNDAAIASKAYPFWLFKFGTEDEPWDIEEVSDFMEHHEMDNFKPSMKQGVSGDVDIQTISGDTADLEHAMREDVNHIVTGMPMPKFALGGYSGDVNQFAATSQEHRLRRQINEARRELEAEFTPILQTVAEERGLDDPDSVQLHIGDPNRPDWEPEDGQTIRYTSDSPQGGAEPSSGFGNDGNNIQTGNPQQDGKNPDDQPQNPQDGGQGGDGSAENSASVWDQDFLEAHGIDDIDAVGTCTGGQCQASDEDTESLADPRLINTDDEERTLKNIGADALISGRDGALNMLEERYGPAMNRGGVERDLDANMRAELQSARIVPQSMGEMRGIIEKSLDRLDSPNHGPQMDVAFSQRHRQDAMQFAENVERSLERMADQMGSEIEEIVLRGVESDEAWSVVRQRIENRFSEKKIRNRARLIAHMQLTNAIEATKLSEYQRDDRVAGYKIINPCTHRTTPLCRDLAGCDGGDHATVRFDVETDPSDQLGGQTPETGFDGFDPIPATPPFHFGCRSSIAPIAESA